MKAQQQIEVQLGNFGQNQCILNAVQATGEDQLTSYFNYMKIKSVDDLQMIKKIHISQLNKLLVNYDHFQFRKDILVNIIRHSLNGQFIDIEARIGNFIIPKISILSIRSKSIHNVQGQLIGRGSFSHVYQCQYQGKKMAIKSFPRPNSFNSLKSTLKLVLQEYCIMRILSQLKVGPNMQNLFGYHIMVFQDCIQVPMEYCERIQGQRSKDVTHTQSDLRQNLLSLHSLNIIHLDIKLENIAFSPIFNKYVFIDFGISKIIPQTLGYKSLISFRGTYPICSPQMAKLCNQSNPSLVDVYYNDVHCLQVTITQLLKGQINENQYFFYTIKYDKEGQFHAKQKFNNFHCLLSLKYMLFQNQFQKARSLLKEQQNIQIMCKIASFLRNLKHTSKLQIFNFQLIHIIGIKDFQQYEIMDERHAATFQTLKDNEKKQNQILQVFKCINDYQLAKLYSIQLFEKSQSIIKKVAGLLNNKKQLSKIKLKDYLLILSKAIQINSTKFTLEEIATFSQVAIQILNIDIEQCQKRPESVRQIAQVALFLFRQSLKHRLCGCYYRVFLCVLSNIAILRLMSIQQFFAYYRQIIEFPLNFPKKVRVLLNCNTMFRWMEFQYSMQHQSHEFYPKLYKINKQILQKLKTVETSSTILKIMTAALDFKQPISISELSDTQILPFIDYQYELHIDIKIWQHFKQVKDYFVLYQQSCTDIQQLLAQKYSYSFYYFTYIEYLLIFYEFQHKRSKKLLLLIERYEKIQIIQNSNIINLLRQLLYLQENRYDVNSINAFISYAHSSLKTKNNEMACFYTLNELSIILKEIQFAHKDTYTQPDRFQVYSLFKELMHLYFSFNKKKHLVITLQNLHKKVKLQLEIQYKLPNLSGKHLKIRDKRKIYLKDYKQIQQHLRKDQNSISLKDKVRVLMLLMQILFYLKKLKKSFDLCKYILKILRQIASLPLIADFLVFFFISIVYYIPHRIRQFSKMYLLHLQTFEKYGHLEIYFKDLYLTIPIIEILYEEHHSKLVTFVKAITDQLRLFDSKQNVGKFIKMTQILCNRNHHKKQFHEGNLILSKILKLEQNPYYIIWLYMDQLYLKRPSIKPFMINYCRSACLLNYEVRQMIFKFLLFKYLEENYSFMSQRKIISLFLIIIKMNFIAISQIKVVNLFRKMFTWNKKANPHRLYYIFLRKKIEKIATLNTSNIASFDKDIYSWMCITLMK